MLEGIGSELGAGNLVLMSIIVWLGKRQLDRIMVKLETLPDETSSKVNALPPDEFIKRHYEQHEKLWIEYSKNRSGRYRRDELKRGGSKDD